MAARFVRCLAELRAASEPAAYEAFCSSPAAAALCGAGGPDGAAGAGGLWWTVRLAAGHTAELVRGGRGRPVCLADRERYAEAALRARLREFDPAVTAMKQVPPPSPAAGLPGCCPIGRGQLPPQVERQSARPAKKRVAPDGGRLTSRGSFAWAVQSWAGPGRARMPWPFLPEKQCRIGECEGTA